MVLCDCVVRRTLRAAEPAAERERKEAVVPVAVIMGTCCWLALYSNGGDVDTSDDHQKAIMIPYLAALSFAGFSLYGIMVFALWTKSLTLPLCEVVIGVCGLCLLAVDAALLFQRPQSPAASWPLTVLVLDLLLVIGARSWVSAAIVSATSVWLIARAAIDAEHFIADNAEYFIDPTFMDTLLLVILYSGVTVPVLVLDFQVTRGFSQGLRQQNAAVKASVAVAEQVAVLLASYDCDAAEAVVESDTADCLPPQLREAMEGLLENLRRYKPYLPQSVLTTHDDEWVVADGDVGESSASSGGANGAQAASAGSQPRGRNAHHLAPQRESTGLQNGIVDLAVVSSFDDVPADFIRDNTLSPGGDAPRIGRVSSARSSVAASGSLAGSTGWFRKSHAVSEVSGHRHASILGAHPRAQTRFDRVVKAEPGTKHLTLICANRCGFLPRVKHALVPVVSNFFLTEVERFSAKTMECKGVPDLIQADHAFASFNAVRPCVSHRQAGARAAWRLHHYAGAAVDSACDATPRRSPAPGHSPTGPASALASELVPSSSACSGSALCGDFGSKSLQRFMCLGGVSSVVSVADRLAARWGAGLVIDDGVHADAATWWDCRVRDRCVYAKRGSDRPFHVWQVTREKQEQGAHGEWMYTMEQRTGNPWDGYNEAVKLWLSGEGGAAARRAADAQRGAPNDVRAAFDELRARVAAHRGRLPTLTLAEVVAAEAAAADAAAPAPPPRRPRSQTRAAAPAAAPGKAAPGDGEAAGAAAGARAAAGLLGTGRSATMGDGMLEQQIPQKRKAGGSPRGGRHPTSLVQPLSPCTEDATCMPMKPLGASGRLVAD